MVHVIAPTVEFVHIELSIYQSKGNILMSNAYIDALKKRRTQYALGRNLSLSKEELIALVKDAVKHSPSSFNSQSSRALVFGAESVKLWDLAIEAVRKVARPKASTRPKPSSRASPPAPAPSCSSKTRTWSAACKVRAVRRQLPGLVGTGWRHGPAVGLGRAGQRRRGRQPAALNPLVDADVAQWNIPASWKLRAQMPFGSNEAGFGEKAFMDDAERFPRGRLSKRGMLPVGLA